MAGEDLVERIRGVLNGPDIAEKNMFGGVCFLSRGNMVVGTLRGDLLVRVGKDAEAEALGRPQARPMEQGGRRVPGYVLIAAGALSDRRKLGAWLELAMAHVATLPPKAVKPAKTTRRKSTKVSK